MSEKFTVILDAGHGGSVPKEGSMPNNAVGANGLLEKDLTLNLAKIAAAKLHSKGFRVLLTRTQDKNSALTERAGKSKEIGADAFVSIHFNGNKDEKIDGTEVFVSHASDEKDFALANELLNNTAQAAEIIPRGIRQTNFTVLKGDFHVPKTAACLIEMAYLTNPQQAQKLLSPVYVERLAEAVAQSISNYSKRLSYSKSLEDTDTKIEKKIAEISKQHSDAKNFPIDLPEPGKGTDTFQISIPKDLKLSRWEVEVTAISTGAGYKVAQSPKSGAEGTQQISVDWWHLPYGKINYKFIAYASPDGKSSAVEKIVFEKAGWMEKAKDQIAQENGLQLVVKGKKAKQIYEAMKKHQAKQGKNPQQMEFDDVATAMEPVTITVVILVGIVIFGILVALGLLTLGAIIKMALDKGYNVKDTKFKAGVGEGQLRQDHELAFNLTKPEKTSAQSFSFGSEDELSSAHFQPLDYFQTRALGGCENSQEITPGAEFVEFGLMKVESDLTNQAKNVCLRWNKIPADICEIDIVVHFHGFDIRKKEDRTEPFFKYVEKISGLDLKDRKRPTLCILPFGYSTDKWKYTFPFFSGKDGLKKLVEFALKYLADKHKLKNIFSLGRVILTAHSGGGAVVGEILNHKNTGTLEPKGKDIDEVHLFDATYGGVDVFNTWAAEKIKSKSGALRVLYRVCGSDVWKYKQRKVKKDGKEELVWYCDDTETETKARRIGVKLDNLTLKDASLQKSFRVEETKVGHNDIPKTFGFQLLGDPRRDLIPSPSKATDKPAKDVLCCPTFPNCVCRDKPAEQKSLGLNYEDADYFAGGETSFKNY